MYIEGRIQWGCTNGSSEDPYLEVRDRGEAEEYGGGEVMRCSGDTVNGAWKRWLMASSLRSVHPLLRYMLQRRECN